jgi:hypothetical protein
LRRELPRSHPSPPRSVRAKSRQAGHSLLPTPQL